ncbi:tyrosine-type recombinase/integrase [Comamonas koreensis]|uniref:tyrosine-type recombinase/integrase n=1 Tax=Comamonas koreensis TaxID=160825 RepID=UPI0015F85C78|nr:site-specific integrase [Comamonas koreensis]
MLTDTILKNIKPTGKVFKMADRDGLYVRVSPKGARTFAYNYRVNGRQETINFGQYGIGGITLAEARQKLSEAKRLRNAGVSPARAAVAAVEGERTFASWAEEWMEKHRMADSTRAMKRSVYERDLKPYFHNKLMREIDHHALRRRTDEIVARGAPAVAIQARDIVMMVFRYAVERGLDVEANPADRVKPSSIATFVPRDRMLQPTDIKTLYTYLERVGTGIQFKVAIKLLLLTMVRKSELTLATWDEVDFEARTWTIPKERMKMGRPHVVYLSRQAFDLMIALKTFGGSSSYVLPNRYEFDKPMSAATLNRVISSAVEKARGDGVDMPDCGPHDMRRTASTLLNEAGYATDWIEKCLAHEQRGVRAVYNKAEYREQRTAMLQDWADMVDRWTQ